MAAPAAILSIMVKAQGAQAAIGQLNGVDAAARKAGSGVDALEKKSAKGRAAFDKVGKGAGIVAGGVALIGAAAVNSAAKYEQSMNTLQAVSSSTAGEMKQLSKLAIKLGADVRLPGTSAQDAAEAMTEMIKAGVSLKDTMAGVRDTLVLSAAAGISNAEAAEIASNALNAFKLQGKDVKMVTDQLANTANASSVEIKDVADSFKMAAAVFSGFQAPTLGAKKAMTELNVAIGILGNAGIKGSDAGTSLKQMLLQLTGPAAKTKNLMRDLFLATDGSAEAQRLFTVSIEGTTKEIREKASGALEKLQGSAKGAGDIAYTAAGKMRSLPEIIDQVTRATKGMTDEQKNQVITQIFGADATRAVIALMNAGPAAFDKMTAAVTKQGAAQALADAKMKGFKGSMEALRSTLETLAINVGTKLLPSLTALVKQLSAVAGALSPTAWLVLIGVIGTLSVAVFGINAAMKVYQAGVVASTAVTWLWDVALTAATGGLNLVIPAIAAMAVAIGIAYAKSKTFRDIVSSVAGVLRTALVGGIRLVLGAFSTFLGAISTVARALGRDGLADKAAAGQRAIDDLRDSLNKVPGHKDVEVAVKIKLDGQDVDVSKAKPLSPTPPGGDGPGVIGSRIGDLVRKSQIVKDGAKKLVADGLGSLIPGIGSGKGVGSLMGANASLKPFAAVGAQFGLHVSSGKRAAGARTSSGGISYHGSGQAIDLANGAGPDAPKMAAFTALRSKYGARLAELIYTPAGGKQIKDGHNFLYTGSVARDHFDHVHVAFTGGAGTALGQAGNRGDGIGNVNRTFPKHGSGNAAGHVQLPPNVVRQIAVGAGLPGPAFEQIAHGESTFFPGIVSNDGGWGLWQMTPRVWGAEAKAKLGQLGGIGQMLNPLKNAMMAKWLFDRGGLSPWYGTKYLTPEARATAGAAKGKKGPGFGALTGGGTADPTGASGGGASNAVSGAATAAARVNPLDQSLATADLAIEQAKHGGTVKAPGIAGRKISSAMRQWGALTSKRTLISKRIASIRKALKGKPSAAKRLALTQELTQRLQEHAQLSTDIAALRNPAATDTGGGAIGGGIGGDGGSIGDVGGDPNQPLIDAINAAAEQAAEDARIKAEADKAHTEALNALQAELKTQNQFATDVRTVQMGQLAKGLADFISGQIGGYGGVAGRSLTAGAGTVVRY